MRGSDENLRKLAQAHGVYLEYFDLHGQQHAAHPATLRALLCALGVAADNDAEIEDSLQLANEAKSQTSEHIVMTGDATSISVPEPCDWALLDESNSVLFEGRAEHMLLLPALEVGYFHLHLNGPSGKTQRFVLSRPHRAPDVPSVCRAPRIWGATGALYGLRSSQNGGLGNYSDLGRTTEALGAAGAQFFGVNPVHALGWAMEEIISPYSPSHRGMFNIDHIATCSGLGPTPTNPIIDYAAFRALHRPQIEAEYLACLRSAAFGDFQAWAANCPTDIHHFAQFEALSERYGHDFRLWPNALQRPGNKAASVAGSRTEFHLWLQWKAKAQIADAQTAAQRSGMGLGLYLDLAVGPRPDGAEVWMNAQTIARGVTIGAPPDHLSPQGQSWALAAHAPGPLARAHYVPFRSMLQTLMQTCGLLRIDHALGLLRSFWLPDDGSPGGYVTQPLDALLAVILIEAHKANCVVVGEDLGLVPDGFRDKMNSAGLYSYAVWQFETNDHEEIRPAQTLPPFSLACFSTHDTPTLNGFWHGIDIDWWHRVGWVSDSERTQRHANRARQRVSLRQQCAMRPDLPVPDIANTIQGTLAQSSSAMVSVQLDDVFHEVDAQNLPGTINEHPNWRRRLSVPVEEIAHSAQLQHVAHSLNMHRRCASVTGDIDHPEEVSA